MREEYDQEAFKGIGFPTDPVSPERQDEIRRKAAEILSGTAQEEITGFVVIGEFGWRFGRWPSHQLPANAEFLMDVAQSDAPNIIRQVALSYLSTAATNPDINTAPTRRRLTRIRDQSFFHTREIADETLTAFASAFKDHLVPH
jgi:hypothetical protein